MNLPTSIARSSLVLQAKYPHYNRPGKDKGITKTTTRASGYDKFVNHVGESRRIAKSLKESILSEDISPAVWSQFLERVETVLSERIEELEESPDDQKAFTQLQSFVRDSKVSPEAEPDDVRRSMSTLYRNLTPVDEDSSHILSIKNHVRGEISKVLG